MFDKLDAIVQESREQILTATNEMELQNFKAGIFGKRGSAPFSLWKTLQATSFAAIHSNETPCRANSEPA